LQVVHEFSEHPNPCVILEEFPAPLLTEFEEPIDSDDFPDELMLPIILKQNSFFYNRQCILSNSLNNSIIKFIIYYYTQTLAYYIRYHTSVELAKNKYKLLFKKTIPECESCTARSPPSHK